MEQASRCASADDRAEGVSVDGAPVSERITLGPGARVRAGEVELSLRYPKAKG